MLLTHDNDTEQKAVTISLRTYSRLIARNLIDNSTEPAHGNMSDVSPCIHEAAENLCFKLPGLLKNLLCAGQLLFHFFPQRPSLWDGQVCAELAGVNVYQMSVLCATPPSKVLDLHDLHHAYHRLQFPHKQPRLHHMHFDQPPDSAKRPSAQETP